LITATVLPIVAAALVVVEVVVVEATSEAVIVVVGVSPSMTTSVGVVVVAVVAVVVIVIVELTTARVGVAAPAGGRSVGQLNGSGEALKFFACKGATGACTKGTEGIKGLGKSGFDEEVTLTLLEEGGKM